MASPNDKDDQGVTEKPGSCLNTLTKAVLESHLWTSSVNQKNTHTNLRLNLKL